MSDLIVSASAPGRCGIIGNPSDMYGGHVVSASIPMRNIFNVFSTPTKGAEPDSRLLDAVQQRYPSFHPIGVSYKSEVPRSSGLSGSTAMLAAILAVAMFELGELPNLSLVEGKTEFAETLRDIERNEAKVVCGFQDAYMITFGGIQSMNFSGKHPVKSGPPAKLMLINCELPFLLVTSGIERLSGSVHGSLSQRWLDGDPLVRNNISRCGELGRLGESWLENQDWSHLAAGMNENQKLICDMGGSGEVIDNLVKDCLECGAIAAKLAGAGLGGTVIALTLNKLNLEQNLRARGYDQFISPRSVEGIRIEPS